MISGSDCPSTNNVLSAAFYHVSKLQQFLGSIISFDIWKTFGKDFVIANGHGIDCEWNYFWRHVALVQTESHESETVKQLLKKIFLTILNCLIVILT